MGFPLTPAAQRAISETNIEPTYAFCIDGVDYCFTAVAIQKYVEWGDPGLFFDGTWEYGGLRDIDGQKKYISLDGSSKKISQQLFPDRGSVSNVSSVTIRVIDKNKEVSQLITPGLEVTDILGSRAELLVGFLDTAFPQDYIKIFAGTISDIVSGAGWVEFTVNHPDEKKRSRLFEKADATLSVAINDTTTTITALSDFDTEGFLVPSDDLRAFVRIDDEFIEYTGISGTTLTGVSRGALSGTDPRAVAAPHDANSTIESFYILEGDTLLLALKLMLSGSGDFVTGQEIENFVLTENFVQVPNAIYFEGLDLVKDLGLVVGDTITVTGATIGGNNVTAAPILELVSLTDGSYCVVADTLTLETDSPAVASFKSQYDVLPDGLGMDPRDVDVAEHEFIRETFIAGFNQRFYLRDTIEEGKEFIEKQLYVPAAGYALPRGTRSSLGIHIAPFPFSDIQTLDSSNIKNPSRIKLRRAYAKNFYNAIVFKYDEDLYEGDAFARGTVTVNATSIEETRRKKEFVVEAKGMRSDLQAQSRSQAASNRLLDRYKRGAEFMEGIDVFFGVGTQLEPGDTVILDPTDLNITDTSTGTREKTAKYFEVTNKDYDLSGIVKVTITDTSFDGAQRYALFSPASFISSAASASQVTIRASFTEPFGVNEYLKWSDFVGANVQIRNADFSEVGVTTIAGISGNVITFGTALGFVPGVDYIMEFAPYDQQTSDRVKLLYTHNSDDDNPFADGGDPYRYL